MTVAATPRLLEWRERYAAGLLISYDADGYYVSMLLDGKTWVAVREADGKRDRLSDHTSPEAAKAAAQADHEKRTLDPAALEPNERLMETMASALRIGRSYVLDAMRNDGGIENCEIGYRADFEAIQSALSAFSERNGG